MEGFFYSDLHPKNILFDDELNMKFCDLDRSIFVHEKSGKLFEIANIPRLYGAPEIVEIY